MSLYLFMAGDFQGTGTASQQPLKDSMYGPVSLLLCHPDPSFPGPTQVQRAIEIDCTPGGRGSKGVPVRRDVGWGMLSEPSVENTICHMSFFQHQAKKKPRERVLR